MRLKVLTTLRELRGLRVACGIWLSLFLAAGPTSAYAATYYVNAATGDDGRTAVQAQDPNTPWLTLSRAIHGTSYDPNAPVPNPELASGDTIRVAPGTYDEALGEVFPLFLIDGVKIVGSGPGQTIIHAPAGALAFENSFFLGTPTSLGPGTLLSNTTISADPGSTFAFSFYGLHLNVPDVPIVGLAPGSDSMSPRIENNEFVGDSDAQFAIEILGMSGGSTFDGVIQNNSFTGFGSDPNDPPVLVIDPNDPNDPNTPTGANDGAGVYFFNVGPSFFIFGTPGAVSASSTGGPAVRPRGAAGIPDTFSPTIRNNTFSGNFTGVQGYFGYYPYASFTPTVDYNDFANEVFDFDTTDIWGGGSLTNSPIFSHNTIQSSAGLMMVQLPVFEGQLARDLSPQFTGNTIDESAFGISMWAVFDPFSLITKAAQPQLLPAMAAAPVFEGNRIIGSEVGMSSVLAGTMQQLDVTMSNNTIDGTGLGAAILIYPISTSAIAPTSTKTPHVSSSLLSSPTITVDGNSFGANYGNYSGLVMYLIGDPNDPNLPAATTQVTNNLFQGSGDIGAGILSEGYSTSAASVSCNSFTDDQTGFWQSGPQADPPADLGGGPASSTGHNTFANNSDWDIFFETYDPNDPNSPDPNDPNNPTLYARSNYFAATPMVSLGVDTSSPLGSAPVDCSVGATIASSDLRLTKTVNPPAVQPGGAVTYTLGVTNNGPDTATNVQVVDILPADVGFVSASAGCVNSSGTVTCTIASLANGASQSFQIVVTAPDYEVPSIVNGATVSSDQVDPDPLNDSPTVGFASDANATSKIPTASEWGLILMAMLLGAAGLWLMRKRRHAGAAMMILLAAGLFAPRARAADQPTRKPVTHERVTIRPGQIPIHKVARVDQSGGDVVFTWANGKTLVVPGDRLRINEFRAPADNAKPRARSKGATTNAIPSPRLTQRGTLTPTKLRERLSNAGSDGLWVMVAQPRSAGDRTHIVVFQSKRVAMLLAAQRVRMLLMREGKIKRW